MAYRTDDWGIFDVPRVRHDTSGDCRDGVSAAEEAVWYKYNIGERLSRGTSITRE